MRADADNIVDVLGAVRRDYATVVGLDAYLKMLLTHFGPMADGMGRIEGRLRATTVTNESELKSARSRTARDFETLSKAFNFELPRRDEARAAANVGLAFERAPMCFGILG